MKNGTQGFTLIELLIVIAIIGILAAVLIPNLIGAQKRAYDTAAMSCANALGKAAATYRIDNPSNVNYPAAADYIADADAQESYGTGNCTTANGITLTGAATTDGTYSYTATHAQGSNVYTITNSGMTTAKK